MIWSAMICGSRPYCSRKARLRDTTSSDTRPSPYSEGRFRNDSEIRDLIPDGITTDTFTAESAARRSCCNVSATETTACLLETYGAMPTALQSAEFDAVTTT